MTHTPTAAADRQDDARAITQQFKNRPCNEFSNLRNCFISASTLAY